MGIDEDVAAINALLEAMAPIIETIAKVQIEMIDAMAPILKIVMEHVETESKMSKM